MFKQYSDLYFCNSSVNNFFKRLQNISCQKIEELTSREQKYSLFFAEISFFYFSLGSTKIHIRNLFNYFVYLLIYFLKVMFMQSFLCWCSLLCLCKFLMFIQLFHVHVGYLCSYSFFMLMQVFYIHIPFYGHVSNLYFYAFQLK